MWSALATRRGSDAARFVTARGIQSQFQRSCESIRTRRWTRCAAQFAGRDDYETAHPGFVRGDDKLLLGIEQHWKENRNSQSSTASTGNSSAGSPETEPQQPTPTGPIPVKPLLRQTLQLAVVCALLILWPAWLQPGGLSVPRVWQAYIAYLAFFGVGSVSRLVQFGDLAPRPKDKQVVSYKTSVALAAFILFMPMFHWTAVTRYLYYQWHWRPLALYDVLAAGGFLGAISLHFSAVQALGKDFDRLVAPSRLVTWGPYRWVQHPIYSSYMLLFLSFCFAMHTAPTAVVVLMVCVLYYGVRCGLEGELLAKAFGEQYTQYAARTKRFIPGLV